MTDLPVTLTVNGRTIRRVVAPRVHLADFLREDLQLTGTHLGCEHGVCGACTVRLDGEIVRGCLVLAVQADGHIVETIEHMVRDPLVAALIAAFERHNAVQCAFCSSGMLLTARELLAATPHPTRTEIRAHLSGNFCRCTGYHAIIDAIAEVAST